MFRPPHIPTADELTDKAFRRGSKAAKAVRSTRKARDFRLKKSEEKRVETIGNVIESDLGNIIEKFPSYEQLPSFYRRLLDIKITRDRYKKSLGALQWCKTIVRDLKRQHIRKIRKSKDPSISKEFMGRVSSLLKKISSDLDELIDIKLTLKTFPSIEGTPTIVIAGYPNVGKSTFMGNLTGSGVKIASYPFTTTDIMIGHKTFRHQRYQIIDSPGLLDREMDERNRIELQAIVAMDELADVILFIIDPTTDIRKQVNLLEEMRGKFETEFIVAVNKIDLLVGGELEELREDMADIRFLEMSAINKEDCAGVFNKIITDTMLASL